MVVFVAIHAWPVFEHNGLSWLGSGGDLGPQLADMQNTTQHPPPSAFYLRAWPLDLRDAADDRRSRSCSALVIAVLSSIFIVELAPARLRRIAIPVIRLLASVPSVIYGLIGILVLVPFVGNHLITGAEKASVQNVVELTGAGLGVTVVILTVMITPIMVALICEALVSVPNSWREGAVALGRQPAARDARGDAARDAPGDRRRRRARDRSRARRGDHDLDGLRLARVLAQADRRPRLPLRAAAHARLGDRRLPRRHRRAGARLGAVRVGAAAAVLAPSCCRSPAI